MLPASQKLFQCPSGVPYHHLSFLIDDKVQHVMAVSGSWEQLSFELVCAEIIANLGLSMTILPRNYSTGAILASSSIGSIFAGRAFNP